MWLTLRIEARLVASQWRTYGLVALTLALGIAVASTLVSVADSLVWRPLPGETVDRLVSFEAVAASGGSRAPLNASPEQIRQLQRELPGRLAGVRSSGATIPLSAGPVETAVRAATVTPGFLPLFGLPEVWTPETGEPAERVVVSHDLWTRALEPAGFGVGDTIAVAAFDPATFGTRQRPLRIAAIAPSGFHFPGDTDVWLPVSAAESHFPLFRVIGLLPPGVATARMNDGEIWRELTSLGSGEVRAQSLREAVVPREAPLLLLLLAATVALLLAVWCQASLFTAAEAFSKRRAIDTRVSLGASQRRLVAELIAGPTMVMAVALPVSLSLASWMHREVVAYLPLMAGRRAGFGTAATMAACLIAILFLAGQAALLTSVVRRRVRSGAWMTARVARTPAFIAAGSAAVSVAVLYVALLLASSFARTLNFDYGFETDGLVAIQTSAMVAGLSDPARQEERIAAIETYARQQPGVTDVVRLNGLPFGTYDVAEEIHATGDAPRAMTARVRETSPGLFSALRVPLLAGRDFQPEEPAAAPVAIVTRAVAESLWPETAALGSLLAIGGTHYRVIGIVGDFTERASRGEAPLARPQVFLLSRTGTDFLVRTSGNPGVVLENVLARAEAHSTYLRVGGFAYPARREALAGNEEAYARFMGILAFAAMLMATLGAFATVSQTATARIKSAAIRLGLGANRRQALAASTSMPLAALAVGSVAGLALGLGAGHILQNAVRNVQSPELPAAIACAAVAAALLAGATVAPARVIRGLNIAALLKDER